MKNRLVAIVLTVILVLNNGAALAHPTHGSTVPEVHTVRFGVMEGDEQLLPLERRGTSLVGQGGDFVNAQGEVNTRIEGVYYQNGTLVSASRETGVGTESWTPRTRRRLNVYERTGRNSAERV